MHLQHQCHSIHCFLEHRTGDPDVRIHCNAGTTFEPNEIVAVVNNLNRFSVHLGEAVMRRDQQQKPRLLAHDAEVYNIQQYISSVLRSFTLILFINTAGVTEIVVPFQSFH